METQQLWKAQDVANYLAVPVSTVRYWTSKGFIPHIKLPAAVRFEPDVIVEWTRAMAKGASEARKPEEIASDILSTHRIRLARTRKTSKG
jgi:hypothetical protein